LAEPTKHYGRGSTNTARSAQGVRSKVMAALVVEAKDKSELKLVMDVLKKMRVRSRLVSESEKEDFALGYLIEQADRTKKVSRERIMKKLGHA
jgi:hypothetical protein